MAEPARTLIVGPNWIGDMVMTEPVVAALQDAEPETPIDMLAPLPVLDISRRMSGIADGLELMCSPHRLSMAQRLEMATRMRGRYSKAFVIPNSFISALIPSFARIPHRQGFVGEARYGVLNHLRHNARADRPFTFLNYQRLAGVVAARAPELQIDVHNQQSLLTRFGLSRNGFVAVFPGADGGEAKRWPPGHFSALARALLDRKLIVAVFGHDKDRPITEAVCAAAPGSLDLGGRTSLTDVIDLVAAARAAVGNDTGLMHIAAAVGVPVAGLFGPTSARSTPPLTARGITITRQLGCSPCYQRTCPLHHHDCLEGLVPSGVFNRLVTSGFLGNPA